MERFIDQRNSNIPRYLDVIEEAKLLGMIERFKEREYDDRAIS